MTCLSILQGYSGNCPEKPGGLKKFYITEWENIASYTEASGALTALTMASGKKFWLYEQEVNVAHGEEVPTRNGQNGTLFFGQTFTARTYRRSASLSYALRALSQKRVAIIEQEVDGTNFLFGLDRGLWLDPASNSPTGQQSADFNGYELVWKGEEIIPAPTVSSAILAAVIV